MESKSCEPLGPTTPDTTCHMEGINFECEDNGDVKNCVEQQPSPEVDASQGPSTVSPVVSVRVGLIKCVPFSQKCYVSKDLVQPHKVPAASKPKDAPKLVLRQNALTPFNLKEKKHVFIDLTTSVLSDDPSFELINPRVPSNVDIVDVKTKVYTSKDLSHKAVQEEKSVLSPLKFNFKLKSTTKPTSHLTQPTSHLTQPTSHLTKPKPVPMACDKTASLSVEEQKAMRRINIEAVTCCTQIREALSTTEKVEMCDLAGICDHLQQLEGMEIPRIILLKEPLIVQTIFQLTRNPSLTKADTQSAVPYKMDALDELNERVENIMSQFQGTMFNKDFETMSEFLTEYRREVMELASDPKMWTQTMSEYFGIVEEEDEDPDACRPYPSDDETEVPAHLVPNNYHKWWVNVWKKASEKAPEESESE